MMLHRRSKGPVRGVLLAAVVAAVMPACKSGTEPFDPGDASYSVTLDPPPIIYVAAGCDRYLSYAILSLGRRLRQFDLSINIMNDCTRAGGHWTYGEVYIEGQYATIDTILSFVPDSASTPPFFGSFDSTYIWLTLPVRTDSLAAQPIPLKLGPRWPY